MAAVRRVLFVDDEPMVLKALGLLMRRHRHVWDMVFVNGPAAALAELERAEFDVVVSDMQMPDMDGAELLGRVAQRWPGTRRVILSGYADEGAIQRGRAVSHQWLSKPCDFETLKAAIEPPP